MKNKKNPNINNFLNSRRSLKSWIMILTKYSKKIINKSRIFLDLKIK